MIGTSPLSRDVFAPVLNKLVYVPDSLMAGHYSRLGLFGLTQSLSFFL